MGQYKVRHQCDEECCDCYHFYQNYKDGLYACSAGHDDHVGRHRQACEDFRDFRDEEEV